MIGQKFDVAYYTNDDWATRVLIDTNSGAPSGTTLRDMAANDSGLAVAVGDSGYASYSLDFGKAGTWVALPRGVGHANISASLLGVEISSDGSFVVITGDNGEVTTASVSDLTSWTRATAFTANPTATIYNISRNANDDFVVAQDDYSSVALQSDQ